MSQKTSCVPKISLYADIANKKNWRFDIWRPRLGRNMNPVLPNACINPYKKCELILWCYRIFAILFHLQNSFNFPINNLVLLHDVLQSCIIYFFIIKSKKENAFHMSCPHVKMLDLRKICYHL